MDSSDAIFEKLWNGIRDDEIDKFVIEGLAHIDWLSLIKYDFPEMGPELLEDWEKFDYWQEDAGVAIVPDDINILMDSGKPPAAYFPDLKGIRETALTQIFHSDMDTSVGFVELENRGRELFLIYTDFESWALGFGGLLVVKDLDELTEDKGFYEEPSSLR